MHVYLHRKEPSSDSEDESLAEKVKADKSTRKRRDRIAKATDNRTIFVGNLPVTIKKKVNFYHGLSGLRTLAKSA